MYWWQLRLKIKLALGLAHVLTFFERLRPKTAKAKAQPAAPAGRAPAANAARGSDGQPSPAQLQFNAIVLLHSQLQIVHVYERTCDQLRCPPDRDRLARLPAMFDLINRAYQEISTTLALSTETSAGLPQLVATLREWLPRYLPKPRQETNLVERLACVAAVTYGDEHVNRGMIQLGNLFDPDIADRFNQRSILHRNRVEEVTASVWRLMSGEPIDPDRLEILEEAYDGLSANPEAIQQSLDWIAAALHGERLG